MSEKLGRKEREKKRKGEGERGGRKEREREGVERRGRRERRGNGEEEREGGRAGEMLPEVEGTRPWGPLRKRVPKCSKGPKTTYTTIAVAEKQSKRSKKGPVSLYIGSSRRWMEDPGDGINGARRGRSLPVHPGFSTHEGDGRRQGEKGEEGEWCQGEAKERRA